MSEGQFLALKRAIRNDGFCGVILARKKNKKGKKYVIVDGEHRWRAARQLGVRFVPCLIGEFSDEQAKALTVKLNQIHGYWSATELVSLLDSMEHSLDDLGFSEREFAQELDQAMKSISDDFPKHVCDGEQDNSIRKTEHSRSVEFKLSQKQYRLLKRALSRASKHVRKARISRTSALEFVLNSYLKSAR